MNLKYIIIICAFIIGCMNEGVQKKITIETPDKGIVQFSNEECEFDNKNTQSQFAFPYSSGVIRGYRLFALYKNLDSQDSVISKLVLSLNIELPEENNGFSNDNLEKTLQDKDSIKSNLHLEFELTLCDYFYTNRTLNFTSGIPRYINNDEFFVEVLEYELLYDSDCITAEIFYFNINVQGKLYKFSEDVLIDSILIEKTNLELLYNLE